MRFRREMEAEYLSNPSQERVINSSYPFFLTIEQNRLKNFMNMYSTVRKP